MKKKILILSLIVILLFTSVGAVSAKSPKIAVNVLFTEMPSAEMLDAVAEFGKLGDPFETIPAVSVVMYPEDLEDLQALSFVEAATPQAERSTGPYVGDVADDLEQGLSTWNLDVINVTEGPFFDTRAVEETGEDVYVAVLDTGLVHTWRYYFPEERIATEYGIAFQGGTNENAAVSTQPGKWEKAIHPHGTHVSSTIIGYSLNGTPVTGVAPNVKIIPVKVLGQTGSGTSGMVAAGIEYVAQLKEGPLADHPVVINMSLGGSVLDAVEKAAIDYAIEAGVIVVASAGNEGQAGMGYPGAYEPVISVAASGWVGEFFHPAWWQAYDFPEPTDSAEYYITDFSSIAYPGQDLDVAAPGSWIVGPYPQNRGTSAIQLGQYYYVGGTSMAAPHVAGVVALMAEKDPTLTAPEAEVLLESTAFDIGWPAMYQGAGIVMADAVLNAIP